jgi:glycerol-3-phosphate acyltransferase PlsY
MYELLAIVIGYLLGAIPFGFLVPRVFGVKDVRKIGSGNVGATNAYRAAGPVAGILVLLFDIGKGVGAVLLARAMPGTLLETEYLIIAAGMAAIIGHIFTVFLGFKGGKGVNTALGVMITILPMEVIIAIIVFIIVVYIKRYISLGSILASSILFLIVFFEWLLKIKDVHPGYVAVSFLLALLIIFAHRSNIKRLIAGNENKFSFHAGVTYKVKENA